MYIKIEQLGVSVSVLHIHIVGTDSTLLSAVRNPPSQLALSLVVGQRFRAPHIAMVDLGFSCGRIHLHFYAEQAVP